MYPQKNEKMLRKFDWPGKPAQTPAPHSEKTDDSTEVLLGRPIPEVQPIVPSLLRGGRVRLRDLALFYRALGELLKAGVSVTRALDTISRSTHSWILRRALRGMREWIERGTSLTEAMAGFPKVFSPLHCKLVGIAEKTGRIDPVLRELADYTEQLIQMRRTILSGLALPIFYVHAVVFIPRLPDLILGKTTFLGYLVSSFGALAYLYAIVFGGLFAVRLALRSTWGSSILDHLVRLIPVVGKTWRELDYWRIASGMEMMINAGLGVISALRQCASFCRSPQIARALRQAADETEAGGTVSVSLDQSGEFPPEMISLWATGEESGQLDDMLARSAKYFSDRCQHRMQELSKWLPRIFYFGVIAYMAWYVVSFWTGYYGGAIKSIQ